MRLAPEQADTLMKFFYQGMADRVVPAASDELSRTWRPGKKKLYQALLDGIESGLLGKPYHLGRITGYPTLKMQLSDEPRARAMVKKALEEDPSRILEAGLDNRSRNSRNIREVTRKLVEDSGAWGFTSDFGKKPPLDYEWEIPEGEWAEPLFMQDPKIWLKPATLTVAAHAMMTLIGYSEGDLSVLNE